MSNENKQNNLEELGNRVDTHFILKVGNTYLAEWSGTSMKFVSEDRKRKALKLEKEYVRNIFNSLIDLGFTVSIIRIDEILRITETEIGQNIE
jgi:hypothetical protein